MIKWGANLTHKLQGLAKLTTMNFEKITLRQQISTRGGGIEIDLTPLGFKGHKMAAYQNYLGGGMLDKIGVNDTITSFANNLTEKQLDTLKRLGLRLQKYYFTLQYGKFNKEEFESLQKRPISAY